MNPCSSTHSPLLPARPLGITFLEDVGRAEPGGAGARRAAGELGVHVVVDRTAGARGAAHVGVVVGFCLGKQGGTGENPRDKRQRYCSQCQPSSAFQHLTQYAQFGVLTVLLAHAGR